jgi:hypothetical protein
MRSRALRLLFYSAFLMNSAQADRPLVNTTLGKVEGVWHTSEKGVKYAAFMGIPYAKPPIGKLRFEVKLDLFFCNLKNSQI